LPFLSPEDRKALEDRFKRDLKKEVTITLFTVRTAGLLTLPGRDCPTCPQTQELLQEVTSLSPKLHLELHDYYTESQEAQAAGVERVPCLTLGADGQRFPNLKYYGIPAGFEFVTLLEDIFTLSREVSPLRPQTRKALRKLEKELLLQVFVTPT
jgi:hypothetical protein